MNYSEENLLLDYVRRTQNNLEFIENSLRQNPEKELYETTQLINSLLGLLVFPFEHIIKKKQIPSKSLQELEAEGWMVPENVGKFLRVRDLEHLIRYLRNAVAHGNIEFQADENNQIKGVYVWNRDGRLKVEMTIPGLRDIVYRFIDFILAFEESKKNNSIEAY